MINDPYKVLGVSPNASDDEIKRAYRRLAKEYHPDRNPGDAAAAQKMQQINAAYEQIKNPEKAHSSAYGYNPYDNQQSHGGNDYQQAAYQYIRFRRFREALQVLSSCAERNARWYYLSALANNGIGNQVTALEHIRRAVSLEPDNEEYLYALSQIEHGGRTYRQQASSYRGYTMRGNPCTGLLLCLLARCFCPCCW